MTKEELKDNMLSCIDDKYDKSEGSFFYDAITPVAIEMEKSYASMNSILKNAFGSTSEGDYLERRCSEIGIERKLATKAVGQVEITGTVGAEIPVGTLVATDVVNFVVRENKAIGITGKELVSVECETPGAIGNVPIGSIKYFPITVSGLTAVTNLTATDGGYDTETEEALRARYLERLNTPSTSGNATHYKQWAKEVEGVGDAKVYPTWDGPGTVKVIICDRNKKAASIQLVNDTKAYIDANRPIGATVTIASATEKTIGVTAAITLSNGRTLAQVQADFIIALTELFKKTAFVDNYVSYAKIGSLLFDIYGVLDYSNLKVNTGTVNVALLDTEIPTVGSVVFS